MGFLMDGRSKQRQERVQPQSLDEVRFGRVPNCRTRARETFAKESLRGRDDRCQLDRCGPSRGGGSASIRVDESSRSPHGLRSYQDVPAFGVLQHAAEQLPDRIAIVYGDRVWSYDQLNRDTIRAAAMFQRLGIRPGDRVGILLPNVPEYIIAANAIWRVGGIAIAISPLMVAEEVHKLLKNTGCRHVVCLDMLSHLVDEDATFGNSVFDGFDSRASSVIASARLPVGAAQPHRSLDITDDGTPPMVLGGDCQDKTKLAADFDQPVNRSGVHFAHRWHHRHTQSGDVEPHQLGRQCLATVSMDRSVFRQRKDACGVAVFP